MRIESGGFGSRIEAVIIESRDVDVGSEEGYVGGMVLGNDIYLPPAIFPDRFSFYTHESRHIIGEKLSFVRGDVLTPDEVKKTKIKLSFEEHGVLYDGSESEEKGHISQAELSILNRTIAVYTKGNFDVGSINLHNLSEKDFINLASQFEDKNRFYRNEDGKLFSVSSRKGRNAEIDSIATNIACLTILENSLAIWIFRWKIYETLRFRLARKPGSHGRAQEIVKRAYSIKGMILPSSLDLGI
jgi:hypothetical protein